MTVQTFLFLPRYTHIHTYTPINIYVHKYIRPQTYAHVYHRVSTAAIAWERHEQANCYVRSKEVFSSFAKAAAACESYGPHECGGISVPDCETGKKYYPCLPGRLFNPLKEVGLGCVYTSTCRKTVAVHVHAHALTCIYGHARTHVHEIQNLHTFVHTYTHIHIYTLASVHQSPIDTCLRGLVRYLNPKP